MLYSSATRKENLMLYGTIARFRIKPGTKEEFVKAMDGFGGDFIPGWKADYYFQMDRDPDEFYLVAVFQDQGSYQANADSPEQHERYLKFRSFLAADPEWHDGSIVSSTGPEAVK
jgi:quinol monooxygenase YgiN